MPRIYVEFSGLDRIGSRCKSVGSKVDGIQSDLQRTIRQLDWDVRYASNINSTAGQIAHKLEQYSGAVKAYQQFIEDARREYVKLDEYQKLTLTASPLPDANHIAEPGRKFEYDWKDIVKSFGSAGSVFGIACGFLGAKSWIDWGNVGVDVTKTISSIAKDYNRYNKIGRAIGTTNANHYFWRNFFGLNKVGHASVASTVSARFYNNLFKKTSPYKLSDVFDSFTGKNGAVSAVASWAGVALSGITNAFRNIEEQKQSNGTMSTERVIAETVSETVIDTAISAVGYAVVGAAITAITGSVAAPVVVAVATGAALAGINTGVEALTGKSTTEWLSDTVLDTASAIGRAVVDVKKAAANRYQYLYGGL